MVYNELKRKPGTVYLKHKPDWISTLELVLCSSVMKSVNLGMP